MNRTIGSEFRDTVRRFPHRIFLTDGAQSLTFQETWLASGRIAQGFLALGLRRHDRLALWLPNSPQWAMVALACARIGVLVVTVNTRNKAEETGYILAKSRAKMLVMIDRYWNIDYRELLASVMPEHDSNDLEVTANKTLPDLEKVLVLDGGAIDFGIGPALSPYTVADGFLEDAEKAVAATDPAVTVFTSGTTGYPKGAMHSHVILRNCRNIATAMRVEPGDMILGHMPFYHIAGLCTEMFPAMLLGCTLLTVAHWQPEAVARLIAQHRVNIFGGIPTHFIDLADAVQASGLDTSCLKSAWIGGAAVTPEIALRAKQVLQLTALQSVYGMTETTSTTVLSGFDDPIAIVCENKGRPIGDFEVAVVEPETGDALPAGEDGEIWVRGHLVMDGYLDDPQETAKVMTPDGWFRTGDVGQYDAAGYLKITGRLKDMFIVGGTNAYPAEIERCLQSMAGIRQAVVVGVPERRLGEVGFAFVEREEGAAISEADVIVFAKGRLADYKVPRHVQFVSAFPLTSTNKIQRHVLASDACKLVEQEALFPSS